MKASRVIMVKNRLERLTHEREEDTTMIKILLVEDDLGLSNSVFDFLDDFADVMQVFDPFGPVEKIVGYWKIERR